MTNVDYCISIVVRFESNIVKTLKTAKILFFMLMFVN